MHLWFKIKLTKKSKQGELLALLTKSPYLTFKFLLLESCLKVAWRV